MDRCRILRLVDFLINHTINSKYTNKLIEFLPKSLQIIIRDDSNEKSYMPKRDQHIYP